MNAIDIQAKFAASIAVVVLILIAMIVHGHAKPFYPACLKPDGDWLEGVTRKQCIGKDVRGKWIPMKQFKKLRNKVL